MCVRICIAIAIVVSPGCAYSVAGGVDGIAGPTGDRAVEGKISVGGGLGDQHDDDASSFTARAEARLGASSTGSSRGGVLFGGEYATFNHGVNWHLGGYFGLVGPSDAVTLASGGPHWIVSRGDHAYGSLALDASLGYEFRSQSGERGGALAGLGLTFRYDVVTKTFVPH